MGCTVEADAELDCVIWTVYRFAYVLSPLGAFRLLREMKLMNREEGFIGVDMFLRLKSMIGTSTAVSKAVGKKNR